MAIRTVVTRGFGNGTFNGTIALVVTKGYAIGDDASSSGLQFGFDARLDFTAANARLDYDMAIHRHDFTVESEN